MELTYPYYRKDQYYSYPEGGFLLEVFVSRTPIFRDWRGDFTMALLYHLLLEKIQRERGDAGCNFSFKFSEKCS